jgi:small-conductance mechanosensitive channel
MIPLPRDPFLRELTISAAILVGSYLAARALSFLLARILARAAHRAAPALDDRLIRALKRPVTYALFLIGAYVAVHRGPLQGPWMDRLDDLLFAASVLLVSLALARSYGILLAWYASRPRAGAEDGAARHFAPLLSKVGNVVIALLATTAVLQHFGVNVQSLVVSLGVGSLAVGLAAQDTLGNMFAGLVLMLDRPFKVGDRIQLTTGEMGDVLEIGIRATRVQTLDDTVLVVPNSILTKEKVVNQSQPTRALTTRVEVGVAYGTDLAVVRRILKEAALSSALVDRAREPLVLVMRFADFAVSLTLIFWVKDYTEQGVARSEVHEEVYRRLREAGIEIPLPVRRIIQEEPEGARRKGR